MENKKHKNRKSKFILKAIIAILLIFIVLSLIIKFTENLGTKLSQREKELEKKISEAVKENEENKESEVSEEEKEQTENIFSNIVEMELPAIDPEGKGVITKLKVESRKGTGKTLVDIENILFWADTQHSIRTARLVAQNITNKKISGYDLIYSVEANASVIGGPSAGAALTIATIAAIENKKPRKDVTITGIVNHDGSIGPVSAILEKAEAAKKSGSNIFLVPLLQSRDIVYETIKHCEKFGFTEICTTETRPKRIDVSNQTGITIQEVENIKEAMKYFFE